MNNQMLSRRCSKVGGRVEVATCSKTEHVQISEQRVDGNRGRERGVTLPAGQQKPARKEWERVLFSSLPLGDLIKHLVLPQGAR